MRWLEEASGAISFRRNFLICGVVLETRIVCKEDLHTFDDNSPQSINNIKVSFPTSARVYKRSKVSSSSPGLKEEV